MLSVLEQTIQLLLIIFSMWVDPAEKKLKSVGTNEFSGNLLGLYDLIFGVWWNKNVLFHLL